MAMSVTRSCAPVLTCVASTERQPSMASQRSVSSSSSVSPCVAGAAGDRGDFCPGSASVGIVDHDLQSRAISLRRRTMFLAAPAQVQPPARERALSRLPRLTLRTTTERPVTVAAGTNRLGGCAPCAGRQGAHSEGRPVAQVVVMCGGCRWWIDRACRRSTCRTSISRPPTASLTRVPPALRSARATSLTRGGPRRWWARSASAAAPSPPPCGSLTKRLRGGPRTEGDGRVGPKSQRPALPCGRGAPRVES